MVTPQDAPSLAFVGLEIKRVTAVLLRAPSPVPLVAAFGTMSQRTALLVRLEDGDGAVGWGEIYANFPVGAGEHRVRLLRDLFTPLIVGQGAFEGPAALYARVDTATRNLALQSGEIGPIAQCLAGIDIAAWDLVARRAGRPLWACLREPAVSAPIPRLPVYASGINPDAPERLVRAAWQHGHRAFKMKLGFGRDRDLRNVAAVRAEMGPQTPLMVDANQAWDLPESRAMAAALAASAPAWLEEPMPADTPLDVWRELAAVAPMSIAAGENLRSRREFDAAIDARVFGVLQPDPTKWGGITGTLPVARRARTAGLRICPHFLGGGLGLIATAHWLAGLDAPDGLLEYDVNPNPLREALFESFPRVAEGFIELSRAPGLGVEPDLRAMAPYLSLSNE